MSIVATKKLLFLLADDQDRTYYVQNGVVMPPTSIPTWLKRNPGNWKDITLQFATNQKYFSTLRTLSTALIFVDDGKLIIADRSINGAGTEEMLFLIILRQDPSRGLNGYKLEYKSRLDISKFNGDPRTGISLNTLQDDVFTLVQANENAVYPIQCNASNPAAIPVLFDGTLLQDKLNYQTVSVPITLVDGSKTVFAVPLTFINNEGDSSGVIFNSQQYENVANPVSYVTDPSNGNCALIFSDPATPSLRGSFSFNWSTNTQPSGTIVFFFMKSTQTYPVPAKQVVFTNSNVFGGTAFNLVPGKTYTVPVNIDIQMAAGEKLFLLAIINDSLSRHFTITPVATTMSALFASKNEPTVNYAIRPLDYLKQLVSAITNGRYTADSKFLAANNRKVILSGSSLRNFPDAVIMSSFADFFQSYTSAYNLGVTVRNGVLFVEPIGDIYNSGNELLDLGEVSKVHLTMAQEFIYTSAKVGYVKQTYNKRNGRYEYNCTHNYKFPINTVLNTLNLVSPYRADSFGMEFIRTGYPNLDSTDDKGDADVFTVMISDSVGSTTGEVSTAISFSVETIIIGAPVIKTPFTNATVYNQNPTLTGVGPANCTISVYADGVLDGTTASDDDGNWVYQIQQSLQPVSISFNGVHTFEATAKSNPTNASGFSRAITLTVNTSADSPFLITSPSNNATLYNNLPLITGIAPSSKVITLKVNGSIIATLVTNSSGIWSFQTTAPLADGVRIISASAPGLPDAPPVNLTVNKNVSLPLITNITYGEIVYNNQPVIKGVAIPGTTVPLYIDGGGGPIVSGSPTALGTTVADANGDWQFQITSMYDTSGILLSYVPDGLHVISTTSTPVNVQAQISGYQLMRGSNKGPIMDYDVIKLDDQYIPPGIDPVNLPPTLGDFIHTETLYNIEESTPLRMLRAHDNILQAFLEQQPNSQISFNGAEVNANLVTKKGMAVFNEGASVPNASLAPALFHTWYLNFTAKVPFTFNDVMTSINNDGYITTRFHGRVIYCLPIGTMNMKLATNEAQAYKLLVSSKTPLSTLVQLFGNGFSINIGKNMIYVSDYNPLHLVKYNYTPPAGFHFADIYDDWQKNRYPRWQVYRPDYKQPVQIGDPLPLQIITNGVSSVVAQMISVTTGQVVDTFNFAAVAGSVVTLPNILQEVNLPTVGYPEGQYWYALFTGETIVAITEKIWLKADWPDTMAYDYSGADKIDFYFSTGIQPRIRVQSIFMPWTPDSEVDIYEDENADFEITRGIALRARVLQFGSETSLISDWMSLKLNLITLLDNMLVENVHYTRNANSKWEPEDLGQGIPEFLVKIIVALADNQNGNTFATPGDTDKHTTLYVLDATAFGQNEGVINVTVDNE